MIKIKCKCGNEVAEGEIDLRKNNRGNEHNALILYEKPNGTIIKNNSNNIKDWTGICPKCQKEIR